MNYISDIKEYIQQKISDGAEVGYYIKNVKIKARKGIIGEKIITIMNNGLKETQSTVLNEGDMIITNPSGEQYRVSADIFKERYTADPDNNGEYFPNPIPQKMLFLTEDISFRAYWGEDMHIKKGGTLNITDYEIGHIYGIQPSEFQETYTSYSIMDKDKKN